MGFWDRVLIGIGLLCWAVLLVIGVVALVRDWLSERTRRRKAIAAVQHELAIRRTQASVPEAQATARARYHRSSEGDMRREHFRSEPDLHGGLARPPSRRTVRADRTGHRLQPLGYGDS